jgi:hypothetical protein
MICNNTKYKTLPLYYISKNILRTYKQIINNIKYKPVSIESIKTIHIFVQHYSI